MARCPICRSNRFRRDQGTGLRFCANGHQQRTARQIEVGDDEMIGGGRQRKMRRARKAKKVVFAKGFRDATTLLLFEAFQLMLKAQVRSLVEKMGFPVLFETVVRDLWLMYVSEQGIKTTKAMRSSVSRKRRFGNRGKNGKQAPLVNYILSPSYQLVFLYLGCLRLQLPVLLADVIKWADAGKIPYINALDNLPSEFLQYVSRQSLSFKLFIKTSTPTMSALRKRTTALKSVFTAMGVTFPEMNAPLILLRLVKAFKVPPELYVCSQIVRMVMGYVEGGMINSKSNNKTRPEVLLVAYLIVSINICYSQEQSKRRVFISWITNLPALSSILDNINLELHKDRALALNKRTLNDLDSEFRGYINEFTTYCKDYLFDRPRINANKWGFQKVVDGLEVPLLVGDNQPKFSRPPLKHQLEPFLNNTQIQFSTKLSSTPSDDDVEADNDDFEDCKFNIKSVANLNDVMGEVDSHFASLIDFGSKVLIVDGRIVLKAVVAVEKGLAQLVELFELQNQIYSKK
ncbi:UNVERIFIED_CONTAM: Pol I core factor CF [Siphonaria sp. JEL0065]|nr:Pol I core factor CF [Siphonaria sp. JEL0065]